MSKIMKFDSFITESGKPTVADLAKMFNKINDDIKREKTGESVVPLTDTEYYAGQIQNIYDLSDKESERLAKELAKTVKVEESLNEDKYDTKLDLSKDQHLMSIRSKGKEMGHIEIENGKIVTNGQIGENTYDNFVELIRGLQGHDLKIDDFFF